MNIRRLIPIALLALSPLINASGDPACCPAPIPASAESAPADKPAADAPVYHRLKGVVVDVRADHSALLVKHEEIPDVMKAMTMLLKVDEATLKTVQKGDAITGDLIRKHDGWWLENVRPAKD